MKKKTGRLFLASALLVSAVPLAQADYQEIDLSNYVNLGFTNSWFINGNEFSGIIGSTTGNQGTGIPFLVANTPDAVNGGNDNFWFGLDGGPGNQLTGPPLSVTIPVGVANVTTVYTLADNTVGDAGNNEFSITFNPVSGTPITDQYVGAENTKDYNLNCATTGCDATPNAQYWFVDDGGSQWLQVQSFTLPSSFGPLASVTLTQESVGNGGIFAGLTVQTSPVPEPGFYGIIAGALGALVMFRGRAKQ